MPKNYLIDGTNLSRGADYDARFPQMEEARAQDLVDRVSRFAERMGGRAEIEIFFDGPPRPLSGGAARVRFTYESSADELILDKVRYIRGRGLGVVVATQDGGLRDALLEEGARVIGLGELWRLCARS